MPKEHLNHTRFLFIAGTACRSLNTLKVLGSKGKPYSQKLLQGEKLLSPPFHQKLAPLCSADVQMQVACLWSCENNLLRKQNWNYGKVPNLMITGTLLRNRYLHLHSWVRHTLLPSASHTLKWSHWLPEPVCWQQIWFVSFNHSTQCHKSNLQLKLQINWINTFFSGSNLQQENWEKSKVVLLLLQTPYGTAVQDSSVLSLVVLAEGYNFIINKSWHAVTGD